MPKSAQDPQRSNRQAQGLACDECRARKLRCDRKQPTCGTCENLGVTCTPNTARQPRGPRRGHLKVLQSRICKNVPILSSELPRSLTRHTEAALERQLGGHGDDEAADDASPQSSHNSVRSHQSPRPQSEAPSDGLQDPAGAVEEAPSGSGSGLESSAKPSVVPPSTLLGTGGISGLHGLQSANSTLIFPTIASSCTAIIEPLSTANLLSDMAAFDSLPTDFDPSHFVSPPPSSKPSTQSQSELTPRFNGIEPTFPISELTKADLNLLYFDRVHLFAPILNKRRYFVRAKRPSSATAPFVRLQYAMWTLAACLGSQFREIQMGLYNHTRVLLEEWELSMGTAAALPLELAQAWIFLAMYEIMQVDYDRGWLSAGRCFRLVQLMKLHEVDEPNKVAQSGHFSWVEMEERRRTFWMAYSLDRFINLINQMPLMLNEQVILTRLPAPEAAFQRDRPIQTRFLSEVIAASDDLQKIPPFNACIVLVTISGRCLSHQQQGVVERAYGNMSQDFLSRHQWLENLLADKIKTTLDGATVDPDDEPADPMLLFTKMAAQATTLLLSKAMQSRQWGHQGFAGGCEPNLITAAQTIFHLSQLMGELGLFKIHPFTPIPLSFCAEFADGRRHEDPTFRELYDTMRARLQEISAVNLLAKTCMSKLTPVDMDMNTEVSAGLGSGA